MGNVTLPTPVFRAGVPHEGVAFRFVSLSKPAQHHEVVVYGDAAD